MSIGSLMNSKRLVNKNRTEKLFLSRAEYSPSHAEEGGISKEGLGKERDFVP